METEPKTLLRKISQAGSMMVEAMAMLALIALVTPTLYKKSAERTSELQDINTATHLRTIMKAVDSYVTANYQSLLEDQLPSEDSIYEIDLSSSSSQISQGIHDYFPYGYQFDEIKNFDAPKVVLKRQGASITSFVELPKKLDIGNMRTARIASMVGSNGGYVDTNGSALGVGGVWSLTQSELNELGLDTTKGSIVVASSDAINSASSGSLENEKYLQRTAVESDDQLWRNTMVTDLYMGGVQDAMNMYKILGVDQLIIGSTDWATHEQDLVLSEDSDNGGSAWLAGTFSALNDSFTISGDETNPELLFGSESADFLFMNSEKAEIYSSDSDVGLELDKNLKEIQTDYAAEIRNTLDVTGDTTVATGDTTTTFKAGPDGSYITASANNVALLNSNLEVSSDESETKTNIRTAQTNITGKTRIGAEADSGRLAEIVTDPELNVQGSAYVRDNLEVGNTLYAEKFNTKELHAGGDSFSDNNNDRWLHATNTGVIVSNPENNSGDLITPTLNIAASKTELYGPQGESEESSSVLLGYYDAQLRGPDTLELYTVNANGEVNIQGDALVLTGKQSDGVNNIIDITAYETTVHDGIFQVAKNVVNDDDDSTYTSNSFYVNPNSSEVIANAEETTVRIETEDGLFQVLQNDDTGLLKVSPTLDETTATATISEKWFRLADMSSSVDPDIDTNKVLEVYLDYNDTGTEFTNQGSVYIRRGAIELEEPSGSNYDADQGYGYIEAGRFVSNAIDLDETLATPVFSDDYSSSSYNTGTLYDRYMVNPAYTSVMHDIKLTTRGGARLSDILPDFINKGIYVVNNSYKDTGIQFNNITASVTDGNSISLSGNTYDDNASGTLSGTDQWGSPFMGVVPAPQCPPGYARVITITPAGFQMAQAGQMVRELHVNDDAFGSGYRFVVDEHSYLNKIGEIDSGTISASQTLTGAQYTTTTFTDQAATEHPIYYLGHTSEPTITINSQPYSPQPLYFQQSTWLRSKVQPQANGSAGPCNQSGSSNTQCGTNFIGWSAIMGFIYPYSYYGDIIDKLGSGIEDTSDDVYWNVFPVRRNTLEAYATVYCYFDRTNLYSSGNDPTYVDQYDQLNSFRTGYGKSGYNSSNSSSSTNDDYIQRLNDPTLKYTDPW